MFLTLGDPLDIILIVMAFCACNNAALICNLVDIDIPGCFASVRNTDTINVVYVRTYRPKCFVAWEHDHMVKSCIRQPCQIPLCIDSHQNILLIHHHNPIPLSQPYHPPPTPTRILPLPPNRQISPLHARKSTHPQPRTQTSILSLAPRGLHTQNYTWIPPTSAICPYSARASATVIAAIVPRTLSGVSARPRTLGD
jgi:hypothetical protein